MKYQLIIFDLDGTILDTLDDLADAANHAVRVFGYPEHTREQIRSFVGNGIKNLIVRCLPEGTKEEIVEKVLAEFRIYYGVHCADKTKPYEGIYKLLITLRSQGYQTAVVSNKADFAVQELCRKYFPGLFDCVIGEREAIQKKPAPDMVYEALKELQIDGAQALYVGDSEVDISTAGNAGMGSVIVSWGFREEAFLKACGAACTVSSVQELYDKITEA